MNIKGKSIGRVLVRSDVPHSSTHNFKDFPFDSSIHEALNSMSFEKPKTIQAYVWDAILRGHNVAFVSGARGGKTLGNIMKGPITVIGVYVY